MRILSKIGQGLIWMYQVTISPLIGKPCRFEPTCSEYAKIAIKKHGFFKGCLLSCQRLLKCHPWGGSGYDPVPDVKCQRNKDDKRK